MHVMTAMIGFVKSVERLNTVMNVVLHHARIVEVTVCVMPVTMSEFVLVVGHSLKTAVRNWYVMVVWASAATLQHPLLVRPMMMMSRGIVYEIAIHTVRTMM